MDVKLISYTQHALELLLFTKGTRLHMDPMGLEEVASWSDERKQEELNYMLNTIRSSWEFVDFVFTINDVTRAFTHQLVRHRVGTAFAQQSQRTVDMSGFDYVTTGSIAADGFLRGIYETSMEETNKSYRSLLSFGAQPEDARGLLPTNVCTNIVFKVNLRALSHMCGERLCVKAQGEFQRVVKAMREAVIEVYPWAEPMLRVHCAQTGVCCFPSVTNCKIKDGTFNPATGLRYDELKVPYWDQSQTEMNVCPLTKQEIQDLWVQLDGELRK